MIVAAASMIIDSDSRIHRQKIVMKLPFFRTGGGIKRLLSMIVVTLNMRG